MKKPKDSSRHEELPLHLLSATLFPETLLLLLLLVATLDKMAVQLLDSILLVVGGKGPTSRFARQMLKVGEDRSPSTSMHLSRRCKMQSLRSRGSCHRQVAEMAQQHHLSSSPPSSTQPPQQLAIAYDGGSHFSADEAASAWPLPSSASSTVSSSTL